MPQRRCVGCGRIAAKAELVRIVLADRGSQAGGEGRCRRAVPDCEGTMPGRGAYLCRGADEASAAADCLARAIKRGGIPRALRSPVTFDPKLVESVSR